MTEIKYWFAGSHEEFPPSELLRQAQAAEQAGFDGLGCSDHFAPWFPDGQSGQAWVHLGALGQLTKLPIGTGVTPVVHHYHPGLIAQAFMSLEELYPGRVWLGAGSGEALRNWWRNQRLRPYRSSHSSTSKGTPAASTRWIIVQPSSTLV